MSLLEIIVLGAIQGLTEFFPVSSSGHLVLMQNLFGLQKPQLFTDIVLHVGTVLSLFAFLRKELFKLAQSLLLFCLNPRKNINDPRMKLIMALAIASIPTALIGYFFYDFFETLFSSLTAVGVALLITGSFLSLTKMAMRKKRISCFILSLSVFFKA